MESRLSSLSLRGCGAVTAALAMAACPSPKHRVSDAPPGGDAGSGSDAAVMIDAPVPVDAPVDAGIDAAPVRSCTLPLITLKFATLAGCDVAGTANGPRGTGLFSNPVDVAIAPNGTVYVTDFDSSHLRAIDSAGDATTIATTPALSRPFGIVVAANGSLYVQTDDDDLGAHSGTTGTIWKVDPATGAATVIAKDIGRPRGLAFLADGRLALADYVHHVVETLDVTTGTVTLLAGTLDTPGHVNGVGSAAQFNAPWDLAVVGSDLIVSEYSGHTLRRVALDGTVSDFAGTPGTSGHMDGALAGALFAGPKGLAADSAGVLYVSEGDGHDIRKIASGTVSTLAGIPGTAGWHDANLGANVQFYGVEGIDITADGTKAIVADGTNGDGTAHNHVRWLRP